MEDLVTSGASVMETVAPLEVRTPRTQRSKGVSTPLRSPACLGDAAAQEVGLKVSDVVVLIDRQQGGEAHLASKARARVRAHAPFTAASCSRSLRRA